LKVRLASPLRTLAFPDYHAVQQYDLIILGGLSGRLDQTISTLSYLHKLRKTRNRVFVITDDSVGWVLDAVIVYRNSPSIRSFDS
jgi:thiamine pyrophosphokinase